MRANGREARSPIARTSPGRWRSVPSASSVARLRSRSVQPRASEERGQDARGIRILVGDATHGLDRHRSSRRSCPEPIAGEVANASCPVGGRHPPASRGRDLQQPHRPVTRRRHHPASVDVDDRAGCTLVPSALLGTEQLRSFPLNVVLAPGSGANARTRRTTAPAGRVQSTARSADLSFGASVGVPACGVGVTSPSDRGAAPPRPRRHRSPRGARPETRRHHPTGSPPRAAPARVRCPSPRPCGSGSRP